MREIKLRRMRVISMTLADRWGGSEWVPDTPENRQTYEELRRIGVAKFGESTHWIEERVVKESSSGASV